MIQCLIMICRKSQKEGNAGLDKKKRTAFSVLLPEQTEYNDGNGERDERECVSSCVHGLHVGEVQMGIWGLNKWKRTMFIAFQSVWFDSLTLANSHSAGTVFSDFIQYFSLYILDKWHIICILDMTNLFEEGKCLIERVSTCIFMWYEWVCPAIGSAVAMYYPCKLAIKSQGFCRCVESDLLDSKTAPKLLLSLFR